jgi:hypothetical protein
MLLLIRKENSSNITYEARKIPRFLYVIVPILIFLLYTIPILIYPTATTGMLYYLCTLTGIIFVETTDFYVTSATAELAGKKITKSGNWWTGNLKYEFEK